MSQVFGIFPTPVGHVPGALSETLRERCLATLADEAGNANPKSGALTHTDVFEPNDHPLLGEVAAAVTPHLVHFGELMFGEKLPWAIKEIWSNVLDTGGQQAIHTHANSFISGVIYLTESDPSARTVFHKGFSGRDFVFSNEHKGAEMGPFSGSKWVSPPCQPGDMILFPSYLPHEVPPNRGGRRMTIALNAIPARLDSWGYALEFASRKS